MRANILKELIYCKKCKKWISAFTDIYLPDGSDNEGRINHLKCDTIVGYTHDKEWQVIFKTLVDSL